MRLWYLQRAVPWAALLGCPLAAAVLVAAVHRWDSFAALALPLAAMLAVAAAAFAFDEPGLMVTAVTPRGARWALSTRTAAALLPLVAGAALLLVAPAEVRGDRSDWVLVVAAAGTAVLLVALVRTRRHVPRPGSPIASAVVLLGMVPIVLGMFFDLRSPYPLPGLTDGQTAFWVGVLGLGLLGIVLLLAGRSSRPAGTAVSGARVTGTDTVGRVTEEPGVHP